MTLGDSEKSVEVSNPKPQRFRRIASQFIATTIKNVHIVDWGLTGAMPTLIIPALTGLQNEQNRDELLSMDGSEASWIGEPICFCFNWRFFSDFFFKTFFFTFFIRFKSWKRIVYIFFSKWSFHTFFYRKCRLHNSNAGQFGIWDDDGCVYEKKNRFNLRNLKRALEIVNFAFRSVGT